MHLLLNLIVLAQLVAVAPSALAQSYVCAVDAATGFAYDKATRQWKSADFKPDSKYVISRTKEQSHAWQVTETGASVPTAFCEKGFTDDGELGCSGLGYEFFFNRKSMRFLKAYMIGYWNEESMRAISPKRREGDDTPALLIGRCTSL